MSNDKLTQVVEILPLIRKLSERDAFFTVLDTDGVIQGYSIPDGVSPMMQVGQAFQDPTGAFDEVIRTGKPKHNILPEDIMGEAFEGELVPIKDGMEVVGCLVSTYSVGVRNQMTEITHNLQQSLNDINQSIELVVNGIESLFNMLTEMNDMASGVEKDVLEAVEVVNKISSNASRSNMLALNASIEAARSGEFGRGFAVVADQMGKLAKDSGGSATEIKSTLNIITNHVITIISSIKDANSLAKEHIENINAIQGSLGEMRNLSGKLEQDIHNQ